MHGAARRGASFRRSDVPDVPFRRFAALARSGSGRARAGGCVCRVSVISRQRAPAGARGVLASRAKRRESTLCAHVKTTIKRRERLPRRRRGADTIPPAETETRPRSNVFEGASIGTPRRNSTGRNTRVVAKLSFAHRVTGPNCCGARTVMFLESILELFPRNTKDHRFIEQWYCQINIKHVF